ncbi:MAG: DNA translocase FtsK 4TM domain-containing protein [Nitrospirae bacterium]|nr:DNA translocase FtsK 4TM domain-containing protein [Nitrospirota bacterium]
MERAGRIKEEIFGVLYVLAGLVVLFSLISHSVWDASLSTKSPELKNLLGLLGSYLSDFLLQAIGFSAYVFPLIFVVGGVKKIIGRAEKQRTLIYIGVFVLLILSASSLLVLLFGSPSAGNPSGGTVGFLITRLSLRFLSAVGSYLIFIPLVMVALMYLIQFSIVDIIRSVKDRASSRAKITPAVAEKNEEPPHIEETEAPEPVYKQEPLPLTYPVEKKIIKPALKSGGGYQLPGLDLLRNPEASKSKPSKEELLQMSEFLEKKLGDFSIEGKVTYVSPGPVVTMFEFEPAPGIKISKIISLSDDLAMAFKANSLRISPIHGKATLGFEIPNQVRDEVFIKDVFSSDTFKEKSSKLILALGKDIFGTPVTANLEKMPHLLVAGATGAGKSVTVNAMILSLLYRATPDEVRMLMIDPKMLELSLYEDIPHLLMPVITSPKEASGALKKVVFEMERRYRLLAETGSRNIEDYNRKISALPRPEKKREDEDTDETVQEVSKEPLPYIIIIIDELADLMLVSAREVEDSIARLAQMARAAGIHLILATQRPSVDVITGLIKANFPSRIAFHVSSKIDSRIIIDTYGAEKLLGKGDMLFMSPGKKTTRVHGAYVSEEEVRDVVSFIKAQGRPDYKLFEDLISVPGEEPVLDDRDELYIQAKDLVLSAGQASISYIQRRMKIGYNRAASIMEMLEEDGIVGPPGEAGKPREVLRRKQ